MFCVIFISISSIYSASAVELNLTMGRDSDYFSETDDESAISDSSGSDSDSDTDSLDLQMEEEEKREKEKEAMELTKKKKFTIIPLLRFTTRRIKSTYSWTPPTMPPTTKPVPKLPEPRGTFYDFVARICHTLITRFTSRKLKKYMTLLSRSLEGLGDRYYMKKVIKRFIKKLKKIAKLKGSKIRKKVHRYLWRWRETKPHKNNFIKALNNIYTTSQYLYLQDYLFSMRKYADNYVKSIDEETRQVFRKWVFGPYYKLKREDQNMIQFRFKLAMLEDIRERRKQRKIKNNHKNHQRLPIGRLQDS